MIQAACKGKYEDADGTDPFFSPQGRSIPTGIYICFECPVRKNCLEYKERTGSSGLWGGVI